MEQIVLQVKSSIARKWERASKQLRQQTVKAVEQALTKADPVENSLSEEERKIRLQKAREAFSRFNTDLSDFTFNREEANER